MFKNFDTFFFQSHTPLHRSDLVSAFTLSINSRYIPRLLVSVTSILVVFIICQYKILAHHMKKYHNIHAISSDPFSGFFFNLKTNQALMSSTVVLLSGSPTLYYVLIAQLFLHSHPLTNKEHTRCSAVSSASELTLERTRQNGNHINWGVIQVAYFVGGGPCTPNRLPWIVFEYIWDETYNTPKINAIISSFHTYFLICGPHRQKQRRLLLLYRFI
jgi:hypothetical protein